MGIVLMARIYSVTFEAKLRKAFSFLKTLPSPQNTDIP